MRSELVLGVADDLACLDALEISYEGPAGIRSGYAVGVSQTDTSLAESSIINAATRELYSW